MFSKTAALNPSKKKASAYVQKQREKEIKITAPHKQRHRQTYPAHPLPKPLRQEIHIIFKISFK